MYGMLSSNQLPYKISINISPTYNFSQFFSIFLQLSPLCAYVYALVCLFSFRFPFTSHIYFIVANAGFFRICFLQLYTFNFNAILFPRVQRKKKHRKQKLKIVHNKNEHKTLFKKLRVEEKKKHRLCLLILKSYTTFVCFVFTLSRFIFITFIY